MKTIYAVTGIVALTLNLGCAGDPFTVENHPEGSQMAKAGAAGSPAGAGGAEIGGTAGTGGTAGKAGTAGTAGTSTAGAAGEGGTTAGKGGSSGSAGDGGTAGSTAGKGGSAGTAGSGRSAGAPGGTGGAGQAGTAGASGSTAGTAGSAGTAGMSGAAGNAGAPGGTGGTAGTAGSAGMAGSAGSAGSGGAGECSGAVLGCFDMGQPRVCIDSKWENAGGVCSFGCQSGTCLCIAQEGNRFTGQQFGIPPVTDKKTGLVWWENLSNVTSDLVAAKVQCGGLPWRLPTAAEVLDILAQQAPAMLCKDTQNMDPVFYKYLKGKIGGPIFPTEAAVFGTPVWTSNVNPNGDSVTVTVNTGELGARSPTTKVDSMILCVKLAPPEGVEPSSLGLEIPGQVRLDGGVET